MLFGISDCERQNLEHLAESLDQSKLHWTILIRDICSSKFPNAFLKHEYFDGLDMRLVRLYFDEQDYRKRIELSHFFPVCLRRLSGEYARLLCAAAARMTGQPAGNLKKIWNES
ncbi:hypothetical protein [Anaerolentibacter hominis]|uniref:hypothetical protein n=1 Tax=Anaerolentibacter hominis TaxID=3079009 RepID=UPI0031B837FC